jgi:putative DNA primase/helicase
MIHEIEIDSNTEITNAQVSLEENSLKQMHPILCAPNRKIEFRSLGQKGSEAEERTSPPQEVASEKQPEQAEPEFEIRYQDFGLNDSGLYIHGEPEPTSKQKKKVGSQEEQKPLEKPIFTWYWVCPAVFPIGHLRTAEGEEHAILIEVYDGEKIHRKAIPRQTIGNQEELKNILLSLNQKIIINDGGKRIRDLQYFLLGYSPKDKFRKIDSAGWHGEQFVFLDGTATKAHDGEQFFMTSDQQPKGVGARGTLKDWQSNVIPLCVDNSRLIFALGVALAPPCLQLVGEDGGGFNLYGESSKGKTRVARTAASVWGSKEYLRSWDSTKNGLEATCTLFNDNLLILDELGQADSRDLGEAIYAIFQGQSKQRMTKTISARRAQAWRVLVLATGEIAVETQMSLSKKKTRAGQQVRLIDVPAIVGQHGCFETIHGHLHGKSFADALDEACKNAYGTAGKEFIIGLIKLGRESVGRDLRHLRDSFINDNAHDMDGQVLRVASRFGVVYGALTLAIRMMLFNGLISEGMVCRAITQCFRDWLKSRGTTGALEPLKMLEQVRGLLYQGSEGKFGDTETRQERPIHQELWGYRYGNTFYVLPWAFENHLCEGFDSRQVAKLLIERGWLKPDSEGRSRRPERITAHGKQDRFCVIEIPPEEEKFS